MSLLPLCLLVLLAVIPLMIDAQSCGTVTEARRTQYTRVCRSCGSWWRRRRTCCSTRAQVTYVTVPNTECGCSEMSIAPRSEWGARPPRNTAAFTEPLEKYVVHHTTGHTCCVEAHCVEQIQSIQNEQMDDPITPMDDIAFHYLIDGTGRVYEGRGWENQGEDSSGMQNAYDISMMGTHESELPTKASLDALKNLMICGFELNHVVGNFTFFGNRAVNATDRLSTALFAEVAKWDKYGGEI